MPTGIGSSSNLTCFYEITRELALATSLQGCLENITARLAEWKDMENGTISIITPATGELRIEVAHGFTDEAKRRGRYKLGEGITGKVVVTGEPIIVPQIGDEPQFLNRTRTRGIRRKKKSSFLCVPIVAAQQVIGALSVDRVYQEEFDTASQHDLWFLTVVSGLIAETVQRLQEINEEKEALCQDTAAETRGKPFAKNQIQEIIGNSPRMQETADLVRRVANSNVTVLLCGEPGTGKTLIAKVLHQNSSRSGGPFVVVKSSELPGGLLERELFGYEKGAFIGAAAGENGKVGLAKGGTLFLDEIGEISPAVQIKLLNVIQEQTSQRLGSSKSIKTNIRLVVATNCDLETAVRERSFREDLYYRLNVFPIYLPPLRERLTDIPLLAEYFLEKYAKENHKKIKYISTTAHDLFVQYHWPGNVRELQHCMKRAVLICDEPVIKPVHLLPSLQSLKNRYTNTPFSLAKSVEHFERELIIETLKKNNGNQVKAAKSLKTSLRILNYKIHSYKIEPKQFKR
jgi:Nif-specific regulatory protein